MITAFSFVVPGEPVPKGRARARVIHTRDGRAIPTHYTPKETAQYEKKVRDCCQLAANIARWSFTKTDRFAIEVRVFRTYEGKGGDADNYLKCASDSMNKIAYPDDRYVKSIFCTMHQDAKNPRLEVLVTRWNVKEDGRAA